MLDPNQIGSHEVATIVLFVHYSRSVSAIPWVDLQTSTFLKILPIIAVISLVSLLLVINQSNLGKSQGRQCYVQDGTCETVLKEHRFAIAFLHALPQVEEELKVQIQFPQHLQLVETYIEGTNMYMGRTRVETLALSNVGEGISSFEGITFLGACSEPSMRWRLVAEFADDQGDRESVYFNFQTQQ